MFFTNIFDPGMETVAFGARATNFTSHVTSTTRDSTKINMVQPFTCREIDTGLFRSSSGENYVYYRTYLDSPKVYIPVRYVLPWTRFLNFGILKHAQY